MSSFSRLCKPVPPRSACQAAIWETFPLEDSKKNTTAFGSLHEIDQSSLNKMELKSDSMSNTHRGLITPRPRNDSESSCKIIDISLFVPRKGSQRSNRPILNHLVVDSQPADQNQLEPQSILQPKRSSSARVIRNENWIDRSNSYWRLR